MRSILLFALFAAFYFNTIQAQNSVPQGINYQAVARDSEGLILQDKPLNITVTILKDSINTVYTEEHFTNSNKQGLFNLVIGTGDPLDTNKFKNIQWGSGDHYIQLTVNGEKLSSAPKLWSVPYALHAGGGVKGDDGRGVDSIRVEGSYIIAYYTGSVKDTVGVLSTSFDTDNQNLSISGDSIIINDGNDISLSPLLDPIRSNLSSITDQINLHTTSDQDMSNTNELVDSLLMDGNTLSLFQPGDTVSVDLSNILNTDTQNLSLSGDTIRINNGDSVVLTDLLQPLRDTLNDVQDSIGVIRTNLNAHVNSDLDKSSTNELVDSLRMDGNTLSLFQPGDTVSVDLSNILNTDTQNLSLSGDTIRINNGDSVVLTDLLQPLRDTLNDVQDSIGVIRTNLNAHVNSDLDKSSTNELVDSLRMDGNTLSLFQPGDTVSVDLSNILNTDTQNLSLSGDTIRINNGDSVVLTDLLQPLRDTLNDVQDSIGVIRTNLNAHVNSDLDKSSTNELVDSLRMDGNTLSLFQPGDTVSVDLSNILNTDTQNLSLSGDTIRINNGDSVVLTDLLQPLRDTLNDVQDSIGVIRTNLNAHVNSDLDKSSTNELVDSLRMDGNTLSLFQPGDTVSVDLSNILNTDTQNLSLSGDTIRINNGDSVILTDLLQPLRDTLNDVQDSIGVIRTNLNAHVNSDLDKSSTNELVDSLRMDGNTLSLFQPGDTVSVDLSNILNTDTQNLSLSGDTIRINNGDSVVLTDLLQPLRDTLNDVQDSIGVIRTNLNAHVNSDLDKSSTNELVDSLRMDGNTLSLFQPGDTVSVDLSNILNTDTQNLSLSGDTIRINNGDSVVLTDLLQPLRDTLNDVQDSIGVIRTNLNAHVNSDLDKSSTNELVDSLRMDGNTLSLFQPGDTVSVDLSNILNTDTQNLSLSGDTIRINNGDSVVLTDLLQPLRDTLNDVQDSIGVIRTNLNAHVNSDLDKSSTNELVDSLRMDGNTLSLFQPGDTVSVDLSNILNTDTQNLSLSGDTIRINNGDDVSLRPILLPLRDSLYRVTNRFNTHKTNDADTIIGNEGVTKFYLSADQDSLYIKDTLRGRMGVPLPNLNATNGLTSSSSGVGLGGSVTQLTNLDLTNALNINLNNTSAQFSIKTSNTNALYVEPLTGNVGLGTNMPLEPLHVIGNGIISANLNVQGQTKLEQFPNVAGMGATDKVLVWRGSSNLVDAIDLSSINTDNQDLQLTGNILSLSGDPTATSVNLGDYALASSLSTLNTTVSGLSSTVNTLNTSVTGLNTTVSGLTTSVNSLSSDLTTHIANDLDKVIGNEIVTGFQISSGNLLSLTQSGTLGDFSVDLSSYVNTDNQQLTRLSNVVTLEDGGTIYLPSFNNLGGLEIGAATTTTNVRTVEVSTNNGIVLSDIINNSSFGNKKVGLGGDLVRNTDITQLDYYLRFKLDSTNTNSYFQIINSKTPTPSSYFTVTNLGKIGIGTSNPSSRLHVKTYEVKTVAIETMENASGNYQTFITTANPNVAGTAITGSVGDLANDVANGVLYYKKSGNSTSTGWEPLSETCPTGMNKIGGTQDVCIDINYSTPISTFDDANLRCRQNGKRLCALDELSYAIKETSNGIIFDGNYEFSNAPHSQVSSSILNIFLIREDQTTFSATYLVNSLDNFYRCCKTLK